MTLPDPVVSPAGKLAAAVHAIENAWNIRDLDTVVLGNSIDCQWRYRTDFLWGREQVRAYLSRKWSRENDLRVLYEPWAFGQLRLAVRFVCEFRDDSGTWFRTYGNENCECDEGGLVRRRFTAANEHIIKEHERALRWPIGIRPADHPGLSELGV